MTDGVELATAYITLLPTLKGGAAEIESQISGGTEAASRSAAVSGEKGGKAYAGGFSSSIKNLAKTIGAVYAVEKVGEFFSESIKGAIEEQQSLAVLSKQLKNTTGATEEQSKAVEEWLTATSNATGLAKEDLIPQFTKLATVTGSVSQAQKLMGLAMNVSAGTGKNLGSITDALVRAQNGSVGGLSRLGIATKDAQGKTLSFAVVQQELSAHFKGDAASAAGTYAGELKRLHATWQNFEAEVGTKVLPTLSSLSEWMVNKGIPGLENLGGWVKSNSDWLAPLVVGIVAGTAAYKAMNIAIAAYGAITSAVTGITELFTGAQLAEDAAMDANPVGLVVAAIAALAAGLIYAYTHSQTFRDIVNGAFSAVSSAAQFMWEKVLKPTFKFIGDLWLTEAYAIVKGADIAFGWIPGIGGKLDKALAAIRSFKNDFNDQLNGIHKNVSVSVLVHVPNIAGLIAAAATGANGKVGNVSTTTDVITNNPALAGTGIKVKKRALGGLVYPGFDYIAGENGPEGLRFNSVGRITPAAQTASQVRSANGDDATPDYDAMAAAIARAMAAITFALMINGRQAGTLIQAGNEHIETHR